MRSKNVTQEKRAGPCLLTFLRVLDVRKVSGPNRFYIRGREARFTAFRIISLMRTIGIPRLSAIFENSPLPLAGNPTTPITFIDNFTPFARPD